ncbi:MAG: membrane or secreted protein [Bacteroidota bacterium]|nr:membrane or secreted protein [Bacteroidota bacterium]
MKMNFRLAFATVCTLLLSGSVVSNAQRALSVKGAWQSGPPENHSTMICSDKYYSVAIYDVPNKKFIGTYGGSYRIEGNTYIASMEYHSLNPETVGGEYRGSLKLDNGVLSLSDDSGTSLWKQIDDGTPGKLAGAWLITGRYRDGQMSKMTPGARRTMKILSGTRFQWIAYNVETREFAGTGGGTYTTKDGKYTEHIDFFSRDNSRVGASLTFDFSIENEAWRHKGLSSKGDPIDEVWTKREKIGL